MTNTMTVSRFISTAALNAARGQSTALDPQDRIDKSVDELASARAHLARVGNNLNQIAFALNAGGYPDPVGLDNAITAVRDAVSKVEACAAAVVAA
jgi:hypothetical protein